MKMFAGMAPPLTAVMVFVVSGSVIGMFAVTAESASVSTQTFAVPATFADKVCSMSMASPPRTGVCVTSLGSTKNSSTVKLTENVASLVMPSIAPAMSETAVSVVQGSPVPKAGGVDTPPETQVRPSLSSDTTEIVSNEK